MKLENKRAIVTGGGGGIGRGIVLCLAGEGADIAIADLDTESAQNTADEVKALKRRVMVIKTDVTKREDVENMVSGVVKEFGGVDILVNNAGAWGHNLGMPFTEDDEDNWDFNYSINMKAPFIVTRAVAPRMIEQKSGKIVNISSIASKRNPPMLAPYCATKAALLSFTKVVAKGLAPHNINVNVICPGIIWTPFWERLAPLMAETYPELQGLNAREAFDKWVTNAVPLNREQTPEDIGKGVVFFSSEDSKNITGQTMHIDGGVIMEL